MDDTEPPALDSPGISPGSGHSRSLQLICDLDSKHENMRRLVHSLKWMNSGRFRFSKDFKVTILIFDIN